MAFDSHDAHPANWPAKSRPPHSAMHHAIDVGVTARELIGAKGYLPQLSGPAREAVCLLIALHDIGKISADFFARITPGAPRMAGSAYHGELSLDHLQNASRDLSASLACAPDVLAIFSAAVSGHHGFPVARIEAPRAERLIGSAAREAAKTLIEICSQVFPNASLQGVTEHMATALSAPVAGLATHADWLASNGDLFALPSSTRDALAYAAAAAQSARAALDAARFAPASPPVKAGLATLLGAHAPYPLQRAAEAVSPGTDLVILEDQTSAGKTEAALCIAQGMIRAGRGRGIFLALPTMATSNDAHRKLTALAPKLLRRGTLSRVHGRAAEGQQTDRIGAWMALETRRALLADIGVGTIDQVLLAALQSRYFALRLHALHDKVLIVDEVHEADPYMGEILERLLEHRGRMRLPTILMSATLPLEARARYVCAYRRGQSSLIPGAPSMSSSSPPQAMRETRVPCITTLEGEHLQQQSPAAAKPVSLTFKRLDSPQACLDRLAWAQAEGMNAIWIRNSIDEAIAAHAALQAIGQNSMLLHSRFTNHDRGRLEDRLIDLAGLDRPDWAPGAPGQIVVSTQVIEAGLNVDFDLMISDLAPMSALLQRMGRCRRHAHKPRPAASSSTLHVHAPELPQCPGRDWLEATLGRGRYIYRDDVMWQTLRLILQRPSIRLPEDTRDLLESSLSCEGLPSEIEGLVADFEARARGQRNIARRNLIARPDTPYGDMERTLPDEQTILTRLGQPQVEFCLVDASSGLPAHGSIEASLLRVGLSRLRMSRAQVEKTAALQHCSKIEQLPGHLVPLPLAPKPGGYSGTFGQIFLDYSHDRGLQIFPVSE